MSNLPYRKPKPRLTDDEVNAIFALIEEGFNLTRISKEFAISVATVSHLVNGKTYKHIERPQYLLKMTQKQDD